MTIEIPHLTDEQLMAEIEDMMAETWVDPMEQEEPTFAQTLTKEGWTPMGNGYFYKDDVVEITRDCD